MNEIEPITPPPFPPDLLDLPCIEGIFNYKNSTNEEKTTLEVLLKPGYGNKRFYPLNNLAYAFCKLMRRKTFTEQDLGECQDLGITIDVIQPKYEIKGKKNE